jgi:hypothetical protein
MPSISSSECVSLQLIKRFAVLLEEAEKENRKKKYKNIFNVPKNENK